MKWTLVPDNDLTVRALRAFFKHLKAKGIRQHDVAIRMGVAPSHLRDMLRLRGARKWTEEYRRRLGQALAELEVADDDRG